MNLVAISCGFEETVDVEAFKFRDSISLLDFDAAVFGLSNILSEYYSSSEYRGLPSLNDGESVRVLDDLRRRRDEMKDMLRLGRPLAFFLAPPQRCYVGTGEKQFSGTGRNQKVTRIVQDVDLFDFLPLQLSTVEARGIEIEFKGSEPFSSFWRAMKSSLGYSASLKEPVGLPLFFVKGTDRVVGSYLSIENSYVLLLPALFAPEDEWASVESQFLAALTKLLGELSAQAGEFLLPDWTDDYIMEGEEGISGELIKLGAELSDAQDRVNTKKRDLAQFQELKLLIAGSGPALENQVERAFRGLGFDVEPGRLGRTDRILHWNDRVAVLEVKGLSKGAGERDAAQLEKWVSEYLDEEGVHAKGFLVVNGFRETPLGDRTHPVFPDQMVEYASRRGHCLITTLQLLTMYLAVQHKPELASDFVAEMFATEGRFQLDVDWSSYLRQREPDVAIDEN